MVSRLTVFLILIATFLCVQPDPVRSQLTAPPPGGFDGTLRRIHAPILMYHYVSPLPADADAYRVDLTVEPNIFREHMQFLSAEGYETISLYQLHDALTYGAELPPRPIILTFDDGYIDHYVHVFPILQEFGFTGTFFIVTAKVDAHDPAYLSWSHVKEMADTGMNMEPHTQNHLDLRARDHAFLVYEVLGSVESLEAHTQQRARIFAYPSGRYDNTTLQILKSVPIWRAVTTEYGAYHTTDNLLEVSRLRVTGNLGVAGLDHLLRASR